MQRTYMYMNKVDPVLDIDRYGNGAYTIRPMASPLMRVIMGLPDVADAGVREISTVASAVSDFKISTRMAHGHEIINNSQGFLNSYWAGHLYPLGISAGVELSLSPTWKVKDQLPEGVSRNRTWSRMDCHEMSGWVGHERLFLEGNSAQRIRSLARIIDNLLKKDFAQLDPHIAR